MRKLLLFGIVLIACLVLCMGIVPLTAQDKPSFEILSPVASGMLDNSKLPLIFSFRGIDNVPIVRFDVSMDGTHFFGAQLSQRTIVGKFDITQQKVDVQSLCDFGRLKPTVGEHTFTIRLTDALGRVADRSLKVFYQPVLVKPSAKKAPVVSIISPKNGATISGIAKIQIEAQSDAGVNWLRVFVDGKLIGLVDKDSFQLNWDPIEAKIVSGSHQITASAWDIFDTRGDSDPVMIVVSNPWLPEKGMPTPMADPMQGNSNIGLIAITPVTPASGVHDIGRLSPNLLAQPSLTINGTTLLPHMLNTPLLSYAMPLAASGMLMLPTKSMPVSTDRVLFTPALAGIEDMSSALPTLAPRHEALLSPAPMADASVTNVLIPSTAQSLPTTSSMAEHSVIIAALPAPSAVAQPLLKEVPRASVLATNSTLLNTPALSMMPTATKQAKSLQPNAGNHKPIQVASVKTQTPATASVKITQTPASTMKTSMSPLAKLKQQYIVKNGDTAAKIAVSFGTTIKALQKLNPSLQMHALTVGATMNIPLNSLHIAMDDDNILSAATPYFSRGTAMVPMRSIIEAKGGIIVWIPKSRQVNAWVNNTFMGVTIGKRTARINTQIYILPAAASIRQLRTMVPAQYLEKSLQVKFAYDPKSKTLSFTTPEHSNNLAANK